MVRENGRDRVTLVTSMRNDGLFLVEWVAYHRQLGFQDILVFSEDSDDTTRALLDQLEALGHVTHVAVTESDNTSQSIEQQGLEHPKVQDADWMLWIEPDQYLNLDAKYRDIQALIADVGEADAILLMRRLYGNCFIQRWTGGSVLKQFLRTQNRLIPRLAEHKPLFRVDRFDALRADIPREPQSAAPVIKTTEGTVVDASALEVENATSFNLTESQLSFENACLNQYAVKSDDLYLCKTAEEPLLHTDRVEEYLTAHKYRRLNQNKLTELSILARLQGMEANISELRLDANICRLEEESFSWLRDRRRQLLQLLDAGSPTEDASEAEPENLPIIQFSRAS